MNYGELKTHFTSMLNRRDLTATLRDTFLQTGISRIQRELRAPFMEKTVLYTIGSTYDGVEIPADYIALIALTIVDQETKLRRVELGQALESATRIGEPQVFARQVGKWVIGPTPVEDDVVRIDYVAEVEALENDEDENTLTIIAPDLVTYAALVLAAEYYLDRRLEYFETRYKDTLGLIQAQASDDELNNAVMLPSFYMVDDDCG
jgi:hypothetical protein